MHTEQVAFPSTIHNDVAAWHDGLPLKAIIPGGMSHLKLASVHIVQHFAEVVTIQFCNLGCKITAGDGLQMDPLVQDHGSHVVCISEVSPRATLWRPAVICSLGSTVFQTLQSCCSRTCDR